MADCIVDEFGPWSSCDVECGRGIQSRDRRVLQETRNGGKSCPELVQRRSCVGLNCDNSRAAVKASKGKHNLFLLFIMTEILTENLLLIETKSLGSKHALTRDLFVEKV